MNDLPIVPDTTFMFFQPEDGKTRIEVRVADNDVWLSQAQISKLYQTTPQNITQHINEIFQEGELLEGATCKQYLQVQQEGSRTVRRNTKFYSLKMILAVGYRVRNGRSIQFRTWASSILSEFMIKGFAMDDERLKNPSGVPGLTILTSFWSGFEISEHRKKGFIRKSGIFSSSRPITTKIPVRQRNFSRLSKTNYMDYAENQAKRKRYLYMKN